ncbi:hypothetical protein ACFSTC_35150 [Nonomuraea ferruginea]
MPVLGLRAAAARRLHLAGPVLVRLGLRLRLRFRGSGGRGRPGGPLLGRGVGPPLGAAVGARVPVGARRLVRGGR